MGGEPEIGGQSAEVWQSAAEAALLSWDLKPVLLLLLLLAAWVYLRGWARVRRLAPARFPLRRAVAFFSGLAVFYVAVASPLDAFAPLLLQAHMVQHLLLTMAAPPLLWAGAPYLPVLSGLPRAWVREGIGPLLRWPPVRWVGAFLTYPLTAITLFTGATFFWHIPYFYDLALRSPAWHEFEHACFFLTALLFWWPVVQPWPSRPVWPRWSMILYLLAADLFNTVLSGFLTFYDRVLYATYLEAPRIGGRTALEDQASAGAIMWVAGSLGYLVPAGVIAFKVLAGRRGVRPSEHLRGEKPAACPEQPRQVARAEPFDLFRVRWIGPVARSKVFRRSMQLLMFLLAAAIIADGLLGPELSPMNLAGVLPWTHWRAATVVALLVAGNLFCMVCPFTFFRDLGRRVLPARFHWPRALRSKWPAVVLLLAFLWCYEVFSLWDRPVWTAAMLLGYFGAAFLVDGFFRRGSFCKYLCPVGQFHFVQSLVSPLEVRVRDAEVCRSCTTHDCLRGNANQRGCELYLFQPKKAGNMDCTFCMDCVQACPHDNVGLRAARPFADLIETRRRSSVGDYARRPDLAALVLVLSFGAFANAAGMVAPFMAWSDAFQERFGLAGAVVPVTLFLAGTVILLPLAAAFACGWLARTMSGTRERVRELVCGYAMGLVPLGFAMWLAHFLFHFFTASHTPIPVARRIAADLGGTDAAAVEWRVESWAFTDLPALELLLLDAGLLASLYVFWRRAGARGAGGRWGLFLPWAVLAVLLFVAGVWIIFQPMEMRGTMMH